MMGKNGKFNRKNFLWTLVALNIVSLNVQEEVQADEEINEPGVIQLTEATHVQEDILESAEEAEVEVSEPAEEAATEEVSETSKTPVADEPIGEEKVTRDDLETSEVPEPEALENTPIEENETIAAEETDVQESQSDAAAAQTQSPSSSVEVTTVQADAAAEVVPPEVVVTEIVPDNAGYDHFEYFEVANTTDAAINLNENNYSFTYGYTNDSNTSEDVALTYEDNITINPNDSIVFWLSYDSGNVNSSAYSVEDFKNHFNMLDDSPIYRITGQNGMANGGDRSIRVFRDGILNNWSYYGSGQVGADMSAEFGVPATSEEQAMRLVEADATPTPGVVRDEQLRSASDTEPAPDTEPTPDIPSPQTSAPLVVTELLVDTDNVNGSDGYEFIEIANTTEAAIDFSQFTINYLYPQDEEVNNNEVLWPAKPGNSVIEAGGALVFWIKNGNNNDLTVADFNNKWGTNLTLGKDIVEIYTGGMANGSARGIQIQTNTGQMVNRAYYNMNGKEVVYEQSFKYIADEDDLLKQTLVTTSDPTPGTLESYQLPINSFMIPEDTEAPEIADHTEETFSRDEAFDFNFTITDNTFPTTVVLMVQTSGDSAPVSYNLEFTGAGAYTHRIESADLTGKDWIDYALTVSDLKNTFTTPVKRIAVRGIDNSPVRVNLEDGQWVNGVVDVIGASDDMDAGLVMTVNGEKVAVEPSLEADPVFVFEATSTDMYFKNGVLVNGDVLHIFDEGTYSTVETIPVTVSQSYINEENQLVVSIYAGTKAYPKIDLNENNDDFSISGMRLILPDGRTLRPVNYPESDTPMQMGDSVGKNDFFDFIFEIPADAYTGAVNFFDTTTVEDGSYDITVVDAAEESSTVTVNVDNAGPVIVSNIAEGSVQKGDFVIFPEIHDEGVGLESFILTLNDEEIGAPFATSSLDMTPGVHQLVVVATDRLGNVSQLTVNFETPVEQPAVAHTSPTLGQVVSGDEVQLEATVIDPTNDSLTVHFKRGEHVAPDSEKIQFTTGTVNDALGVARDHSKPLSEEEILALSTTDGLTVGMTTDEEFPYQIFEIKVGDHLADGSKVRFNWDGEADGRAQVRLYVFDNEFGKWDELDRHLTGTLADGEVEQFTLEGLVEANQYKNADNILTFLVQHSLGFAGSNHTTRESDVAANHPEDEPRESYDFTIVWESDTQYYNETYFEHQSNIHDFILDQRENMNIQYMIHTGDIVDEYDQEYQWLNADKEYAKLDEAGLPYGVLAGNHDVGGMNNDFSKYSEYFGDERFGDNPWFFESHQDNRGHYDLISAGGIDFIMLYMGWEPGDEQIEWMNDSLAKHPERVAIINLHEFMLTTGGLGPIPQRILDEVAALNPNVRMITSGHYHDAYTRTDEFDDDGDGAADRTVTSMLFDYQGLPEGGLGYLRLLHFDNEGKQMKVRTYSPSLEDYNSDEPSLLGPEGQTYMYQEFNIPYAQLGIVPESRTLATDAITVDILANDLIETIENVDTPEEAVVKVSDLDAGDYEWFVHLEDAYGGVYYSPVQNFTVVNEETDGELPEDDRPDVERPGDDTPNLEELNDRVHELEEAVSDLIRQNKSLDEEISHLQKQVMKLKKQVADRDLSELEERLDVLEERYTQLKAALKKSNHKKDEKKGLSQDESGFSHEDGVDPIVSGKDSYVDLTEVSAPSKDYVTTDITDFEVTQATEVEEATDPVLPKTGVAAGAFAAGISTLLAGLGLTLFDRKRK